MQSSFPLFQSHLDYAHSLWSRLIKKGDWVIDATCGNGHDTLVLAHLVGQEGKVIALDIQQKALEQTKARLKKNIDPIELRLQSHATFDPNELSRPINLIVYNLGYLPGANKLLTTKTETTLRSIKNFLSFIKPGGAISITCYCGHPEGKKEEKSLLAFTATLAPDLWAVSHMRWLNRKAAPSLLLLQRSRIR